jgi:hypothetical protein
MAKLKAPLRQVVVAPAALHGALWRWAAAGRPAQPTTAWSLESWVRFLPNHKEMLHGLPARISRDDVATVASAIVTQASAVDAFVAAMVWGFGRVGYGPYRTARVLSRNRDAGDRLMELAGRVAEDGGPKAFDWLTGHRLEGLGVAFSTKFTFFCSGNDATPALVLDRLVSDWFHANAAWRPSLAWNSHDYRHYVETVLRWSGELSIRPADTELLIFQDQVRKDPGSQWAAAAFDDDLLQAPNGSALSDVSDGVNQRLNEIADQLLGRPGLSSDDLADVEHHLRSLRRIAARST